MDTKTFKVITISKDLIKNQKIIFEKLQGIKQECFVGFYSENWILDAKRKKTSANTNYFI